MSVNQTVTHKEALQRLKDGNDRYLKNELLHPHAGPERREELKSGQHPFAVILSCADSRVPPEIVFDQGLGDLFVIRVAGNVARDKVIGSIEYAVKFLGAQLVVVMGHEACGAVTAAMGDDDPGGHIGAILSNIKPAAYLARTMEGDELDNAIKLNAKLVSEMLKDSQPILHPAYEKGALNVVSAHYSLDGKVEFLES